MAARSTPTAEKSPPLSRLRNFVALFGSLFDVGKEARFALADQLIEDSDVNSLLEAEQRGRLAYLIRTGTLML